MDKFRFKNVILVNETPIEFNFIMSSGVERKGYTVFSREPKLNFKLKNWKMD